MPNYVDENIPDEKKDKVNLPVTKHDIELVLTYLFKNKKLTEKEYKSTLEILCTHTVK